jgi:nucleotidyltransferase substrate binding protein (TIGR01987 family)
MNKDIRWKQRFQNFKNAYKQLDSAIALPELSELESAGLVQTFEYTFELAWKTLKDFLESEGVVAATPRQVIQEGFKANFIIDGHTWIDALEKRNLLSHSYSKELSKKAVELIKTSYFPIMKDFKETFEKKES